MGKLTGLLRGFVFAVAVGFGGSLALNASAITQPALTAPSAATATDRASNRTADGVTPAIRTLQNNSEALPPRTPQPRRRAEDGVASDY